MGGVRDDDADATNRSPRIVIVGAGFGGIAAAALLRRAGFADVTVLEKADRVGGVWRDNTYPGCACDIPAPLYSYSFAPNPDWSRRFPPRSEILAYLEHCVADLGLTGAIRFGATVTEARWTGSHWKITCADGTVLAADLLIPAMGQLSRPAVPDLPGADTFTGPRMHTARWDPDLDVAGRRVGVIGTGASAIQLVPAIAGAAAHVTVFQRTPPWLLPKPDRRYGAIRRALFRRVPAAARLSRAGTWALTVVTGRALLGGRIAGWAVGGAARVQLRLQGRGLRAAITPDYTFGCKRVLFSHDWLPTLRRADVTLATAAIAAVNPAGVRTADGVQHDCDILVYGTGFRATEFLAPLRVTGIGGARLHDVWADGARAYLGLAVAGFPNMFLMYGPNTNTGNTSVIYFHESQARYIVQAAELVAGGRVLDVRPEVATAYDAEMQARLADSVWVGCDSWYRTPGGRVVANWPGSAGEYRRRTARLDETDYRYPAAADDPGAAESAADDDPGAAESAAATRTGAVAATRTGADPNVIRKSARVTVTRGRSPLR
jgi:cation diffusion facilitator CzcD-associated flavoprotein CzcO